MNDFTKYDDMSLSDLARAQMEVKDKIDELSAAKTALQKEFDFLRQNKLPSTMEAMGIDSVKVAGVGRVSIRSELQCTVKAACKYDMQQWLRDNDFGDLISEVVNASTLKAFIKEQIKAGNPIPEDYLTMRMFDQASITKS